MKDYRAMRIKLEDAVRDLAILSGDIVGPSENTVFDHVKTCAASLRGLAHMIEQHEPMKVFPSPQEAVADVYANGEIEDAEQCPGCACMPGDGVTEGCDHPEGCGFYQENEPTN